MIYPRNPPISATCTGQSVEFIRETNKFSIYSQFLQGNKYLLALLNWATQVKLVVDDHCRSLGITDIRNWRMLPEFLKVFKRRLIPSFHLESPIEVARTPHTDQVTDATGCDCCSETISVTDDPDGHVAAVATASNAHPV